MKKFIVASVLAFGLFSCQAVSDFFGGEEMVVTTADNVVAGSTAAPIPVSELPADVQAMVPEGMEVVIAPKSDLVSNTAAHIPLMGQFDDTAIATAYEAGMHIAKTFVPGLAGWEALLALLFVRKRKHYVNAFKSALPLDKNVDIGGAVSSLTAALGMTHSSETTEAAWAEEEEYEEE
tara:strand:- start:676 stop:1209 length:534 start_codon:yes stop_codon:yes gene_type:complete